MNSTDRLAKGFRECNKQTFKEFEDWIDKNNLLEKETIFRGQANASWSLEASLTRTYQADADINYGDVRTPLQADQLSIPVRQHEERLLEVIGEMKVRAGDGFGEHVRDETSFPVARFGDYAPKLRLNDAVCLRHCGAPSPLLDWTRSPYVAAHFAFQDATHSGRDSSVAIFVMTIPKEIAEWEPAPRKDTTERGRIVAFCGSVQADMRHYRQQSVYTVALREHSEILRRSGGLQYVSHEDLMKSGEEKEIDGTPCWKITIPTREKLKVLRRLETMNITEYTLMGTDDSLARSLVNRKLRANYKLR